MTSPLSLSRYAAIIIIVDFCFMCMCVLPAWMSVYHSYVSGALRDQKRALAHLELKLKIITEVKLLCSQNLDSEHQCAVCLVPCHFVTAHELCHFENVSYSWGPLR